VREATAGAAARSGVRGVHDATRWTVEDHRRVHVYSPPLDSSARSPHRLDALCLHTNICRHQTRGASHALLMHWWVCHPTQKYHKAPIYSVQRASTASTSQLRKLGLLFPTNPEQWVEQLRSRGAGRREGSSASGASPLWTPACDASSVCSSYSLSNKQLPCSCYGRCVRAWIDCMDICMQSIHVRTHLFCTERQGADLKAP
jgi:hypothetical protein